MIQIFQVNSQEVKMKEKTELQQGTPEVQIKPPECHVHVMHLEGIKNLWGAMLVNCHMYVEYS